MRSAGWASRRGLHLDELGVSDRGTDDLGRGSKLGRRRNTREPHEHPIADPAAETDKTGSLEPFAGQHHAGPEGETDLEPVGLGGDDAGDGEEGGTDTQAVSDAGTQPGQELRAHEHAVGAEKLGQRPLGFGDDLAVERDSEARPP